MLDFIKQLIVIYLIILIQITVVPEYIVDPFQPQLFIIFVVWNALRREDWQGAVCAFFVGLVADCFSGQYLGLHAFSFLAIHLVLRKVADRLYTDSTYLLVLAVILASLANGGVQLLLLLLFSVASGIYAPLLAAILPQALVNGLVASLLGLIPVVSAREAA